MKIKNCKKCKKILEKEIVRLKGIGDFSVKKALSIIEKNKRKKTKIIPLNKLKQFKNRVSKNDPHLNHINFEFPAIIGTYIEPRDKNKEYNFFLDGNNRLAKAIKEKVSLEVYILTLKETQNCLVWIGPNQKFIIIE